MKNLIAAAIILTTILWSCKKGSDSNSTPTPKTLCDSVNYTTFVKPILTTNCNVTGCHSSGAGGLDLRTYDKAKAATLTGKVIPAINHTAGVPAMPQGQPKLQKRQLDIFDCWKSKGCPL